MMNGGRCMRAFRPSYYSAAEEHDEAVIQAKLLNLEAYAARVAAGLPLFETAPETEPPKSARRTSRARR